MFSAVAERIRESLTSAHQLKVNVDRIGQDFKILRTKLIESLQTFKPTKVNILLIFKDCEATMF